MWSEERNYEQGLHAEGFQLLEAAGAVTRVDLHHDGRFISAPHSLTSILSLPTDLKIENFFDLIPESDRPSVNALIEEALASGGEKTGKIKLGRRDCVVLVSPVVIRDNDQNEPSTETLRLFIIPKNTHENLNAESLYHHKLANLGAMTAGVIHDINNLLTGMLSCTEQLYSKIDDETIQHDLDLLENSVDQASDLTGGILAFLREDERPASPIDPVACIREMGTIISGAMGHEIDLNLSLPQKSRPIIMKRAHLGQILLNLVINARDAIGEKGSIDIDAHFLPDAFVLHISDSGSGISPTLKEKVFEPFYSTKGRNKGTGLGLTIVKTIVEEADGFIELTSVPGQGTQFAVNLPTADYTDRDSKIG